MMMVMVMQDARGRKRDHAATASVVVSPEKTAQKTTAAAVQVIGLEEDVFRVSGCCCCCWNLVGCLVFVLAQGWCWWCAEGLRGSSRAWTAPFLLKLLEVVG